MISRELIPPFTPEVVASSLLKIKIEAVGRRQEASMALCQVFVALWHFRPQGPVARFVRVRVSIRRRGTSL